MFQKLKKVNKEEKTENNINITIEENTSIRNTNEDRILYLENEIKIVNSKLDKVINILINKN